MNINSWFSSYQETPYVIAEVAQSHDGNINFAHAFIDAAADAGANAVKFQTHIANCETTPDEPWRVKFSHIDETRYEYWRRMEFTVEEWASLAAHCKKRNIDFLSSAFSSEAIDILQKIGMPAWKVASGEVNNPSLIARFARTGKPILLSSGMSSWSELDDAVAIIKKANCDLAIFQCTTSYPCPPERWGLNVLEQIRSRYGCPVGLSDHSATMYAGLAAVALGATFIEVHVTFHKKMFGPDVSSSLTFEEFACLVEGARMIRKSVGSPIDKNRDVDQLKPLRSIFTKSIYTDTDLNKGDIIKEEYLAFKKPGNGISASSVYDVINKKCKKFLPKGHRLSLDDFE